jgi:hypothetical protein
MAESFKDYTDAAGTIVSGVFVWDAIHNPAELWIQWENCEKS